MEKSKRDLAGIMRLKIYRFIRKFKLEHDGIAPTTREIETALKISKTTVRYHLLKLAQLNMISFYGRNNARNIMLTDGYAAISPQKLAEYEQIIKENEA